MPLVSCPRLNYYYYYLITTTVSCPWCYNPGGLRTPYSSLKSSEYSKTKLKSTRTHALFFLVWSPIYATTWCELETRFARIFFFPGTFIRTTLRIHICFEIYIFLLRSEYLHFTRVHFTLNWILTLADLKNPALGHKSAKEPKGKSHKWI